MMRAKIIGVGGAVPEKVLTNRDLEQMVDTTDDWIVTRTGISERHIASEGEYTSTFATLAAQRALEMASVSPADLDLIIVATVTPDFPFPSTACLVQNNLRALNAAAFDVSAACSGFIYGLSIVDKYIRQGAIRRALVIGAEVLSRIVDWTDRNTCCLFGDGSGAVVVEASEGTSGILSTHIHSDGSYWELLHLPAVGSRNPGTHEVIDQRLVFLQMQGNEVFKLAVRAMEDAAQEALVANGLTTDHISVFIPHQANRRIIDAIGRRLNLHEDKVFTNLDRYGNTSAASIPLALSEACRSGVIKPGDIVLFDAFGGGLTWASALVRW
jgi:3-oxoacyl-[acyl-carrier-protein] synthase-3